MEHIKIVAFDPSESTGVAIGTIQDKVLTIEKVGLILANKMVDLGHMYLDYDYQIRKFCVETNPTVVIQESFFSSSKFTQGVDVNFVLRGLITMMASRENVPLLQCSPSEWKRFVAKRSTPTKEEKILYKTKAKKAFIQDALKLRGVTLPDKYMGQKGKMVNTPSDVWDAIGILMYGAYIFDHIDRINPTVDLKIILF